MTEDLNNLLEVFSDVGSSRGTMNGKSLGVVADNSGGYRVNAGQGEFLRELREYEKRKGVARDWKKSMKRCIRAAIVEIQSKKTCR